MASFDQKILAARAIFQGKKTKEEVAKELDVAKSTVTRWVSSYKTAAVNESLRKEEVKTSEAPPQPKKTKAKKVTLPEPVKTAEAVPVKPTKAPEKVTEDEDDNFFF